MKIIFLGVGEAFSDRFANTSILVEAESNMMMDCGYSAVRELWKYNPDPNYLDIIYISHFHADHYFGIPSLLFRMKEDKRRRQLVIITQKPGKSKLESIMKLAYRTSLDSMGFKVIVKEVKHMDSLKVNELKMSFARTVHSVTNLAVRVEYKGKSIAYSGDGQSIRATEPLYKDVDLLIHEGFNIKPIDGHSSIGDVIEIARRNNVGKLALVHISRKLEREKLNEIKKGMKNLIIPKEKSEILLE